MVPDETRVKRTSLKWAMGLSAFLTLLKGGFGLISSSTALVASALDSFMDVGISSVNYIAVQKGVKPPDEEHTYGHEKIESLASYTQGIVILLFALFILGDSFRRTVAGSTLSYAEVALVTIGVAAFTNLILVAILRRAEQRTGSLILKGELVHYSMDILSYVFIFPALGLVRVTGWSGWIFSEEFFLPVMSLGWPRGFFIKLWMNSWTIPFRDRSLRHSTT